MRRSRQSAVIGEQLSVIGKRQEKVGAAGGNKQLAVLSGQSVKKKNGHNGDTEKN